MKAIIQRIQTAAILAVLFALGLASTARAAAPVPTVVWESDFSTATKTGSDDNSYTITLPASGLSVNADGNLVVDSSTSSGGAVVDVSAADSQAVTVLVKYSSLSNVSGINVSMASILANDDNEVVPRTTANNVLTVTGDYNGNTGSLYSFLSSGNLSMQSGAGYFVFAYNVSTDNSINGTYAYSSSGLNAMAGGRNSSLKWTHANRRITKVAFGGPVNKGKAVAWRGAVIEKVAIFVGQTPSASIFADFIWPSAEKYQKWSYGSRILTWKTPSNAAGNNQDFIAYNDATYDIFDTVAGSDSGTPASNGNNSSSLAYWKTFCFGQTEYSAPGNILRLAGDYYKGVHGKFSPMTLGGLIVEPGATGYSFPDEGTRSAALGDPTGTAETWFEINENFSIARTGGVALMGTVNLDIANGKTLTLSSAAKMMQEASVDTATAPQLPYATTTGGTLKLHGAGKLAATLNASGAALDFTDQPAASALAASAYIQGALTVDADTTFTFPEGATFPYFVATSISGALNPANGYKANADGSISQVVAVTLNISSGEAVNLPTAWTSSDDAVVTVAAGINATLNVTTAATLDIVRFDVGAGSTLTLSGETLTATFINITGAGAVKATASTALAGTVVGDGTIIYNGVLPTITSGISFSNAAWTGTMWLKDFGSLNSNNRANSSLTADMPNWGNAGSKVKFTNVKAYAHNANLTCAYTLVLEDGAGSDEYAWRCDDGYAGNTLTVAKLSGTGTFSDHSGPTAAFKFNSCNSFTGVFDISSSSCHRIGLGANCNSTGGTIAIGSGVVVNLEQGKVWTAGGGFIVNNGATLNVNADATVKFTSQGMLGTLNIAQGKTLTAASDDAVSYNTGSSTVNVYGTLDFGTYRWTIGPNTVVNLDEGAIVRGTGDSNNANAAMDFNVANGSTIHAIGNATISCVIRNDKANGKAKINVDDGKTLTFSGNLVGSYGLKKQGAGVLKLTGSIAKLPTIEAGTVLLGGSKAWNFDTVRDFTGYQLEAGSTIAITQILAEYRCGVTTVTGLDESIASITVNKYDGTTATLMRTDSTSTLTETPVTSGVACWYDFTFTNTVKSATGSSGSSTSLTTTDVSSFEYVTIQDYAQPTPNSYTAIPTYVRPYSGINLGSKTQFCVALFGTMPSPDNTVLLFLGDGYDGGALILASGTSANEAVLYYYTTGKVLTELKRMTASSCRTAPHLYVFQKVGDHQVDIYLDGKLSLSYVNNDITFTLNTGFQVASGYRGTPTGLSEISSSATSEPSAIAMTRIYDRLLTSAEITQLAIEWPYYSPNGDSSRTLDVGETTPDWEETGKWLFNNVGADAATANSNVEFVNNAGAAASVAVNLNANTAYESLAVSGDNAVSFALKSGFTGKIVPGAATFSADTTVAYDAADFSSTRVEVADGKTLTFDVSSIVTANGNWPNAASVDRIQLTGIATLGTGATVAVTPATAGYWNLSAVEDGGYYYLSVTPGRANCDIYWKSGTYWNSTYNLTGSNPDNPAVFTTDAAGQIPTKYFAGDTVIIPTTTKRYFGPISDGAAIQFDCNGAIEVTKTDSLGYVFKNATVTVASGTTLNFVNSWNGASPEVYGGTISGAGKVQVASGITLTLSNGATINSATALAGAGTVNLASVPTAQMTFDNWTGTVKLPQFAAGGAKLTFAGNAASTVALTGITSGWLGETSTQRSDVAPTLRLDGDVTITGMSTSWQYSFAKITGTGNLSFTSANAPASLAITEIADYTGTLNNSTTTALTVGRISLASAPAADTLLLATNGTGTVTVNAVYVNGSDSGMQVVYKEGGVYVSELQGTGVWDGTTAVVTNTTAAVTVPASATAVSLAITGGSASLVSTTALVVKGEGKNVTVYATDANGQKTSTDISSAFKVTAGENNTYTVSLDGSAIVDGVKVQPTIGESATVTVGEEEVPATALSDSGAPSFAIKTIPGLWYAVEESTDANTFTAGTPVKATSAGTRLSAGAPSSGVKYYKIAVGASKAALQ